MVIAKCCFCIIEICWNIFPNYN